VKGGCHVVSLGMLKSQRLARRRRANSERRSISCPYHRVTRSLARRPSPFVVIDRFLRLSARPQLVDQRSIVVVLRDRVIVGKDNLDGVLDHQSGSDLLATDH